MKKNMGSVDKIVRILAAVVIAVLSFAEVLTGPLAWVLGVIAIVLMATSLLSVCPLYLPFGVSTLAKKS